MSLQPEEIEHINLVNWFHHTYPELADDFHHFANERKCSQQRGRILKRMGVKKGVSDLFLAFPHNGYHGLWIELKVDSKASKVQLVFGERKKQRGYDFRVTYGFESSKEYILSYLINYTPYCSQSNTKILYNNNPIC